MTTLNRLNWANTFSFNCSNKGYSFQEIALSLFKPILQEALAEHGDAMTVFTTAKGQPWTSTNLGMVLRSACIRAGIEPCGPHTLRHTFASRLIMAGIDLRTVQKLLDHKDIKMTLRYAHLSPNHKRAAIEDSREHRFSTKSPANFHNTLSLTIRKDSEKPQ